MTNELFLANLVRIRSRFARSVNLELDFYGGIQRDGYILTSLARGTLSRIADGLIQPGGSKAWTLTGPYGSGKSAFALFLASLLSVPSTTNAPTQLQLKAELPDVWRALFDKRTKNPLPVGRFLPVLITGAREPVARSVARGFMQGLQHLDTPNARRKIAEFQNLLLLENPSDRDVLGPIERTVKSLVESGEVIGVLMVLDELGKHLEFSAMSPEKGDLYLLQSLAEHAQRSNYPSILITLLHQSFERYAERLSALERSEWSKVQGRFEDIAFQESMEQNLRLIAGAIEFHGSRSVAEAWRDSGNKLAQKAISLGLAPGGLPSEEFEQLITASSPLHPTVALVLGPLFRRLAQNERSLFAFLSAYEPHGFQDFLVSQKWPTYYTIDQLFDYLASSMGSSLYRASLGSRWSEVEAAMGRLGDHEDLERKLLKCVALLALVGAPGKLTASTEVLAYSLGLTPDDIHEPLRALCERSILVFRSFKGSYGLWEGSDFDIEARLAEARRQVQLEEGVAALLTRERPIRPLVARRHSIQKGVLRYFEVCYAELDDLTEMPFDPEADGQIIYLFESAAGKKGRLDAWIERYAANPQVLLVIPEATPVLAGLLLDLACFRWLYKNSPDLAGDSVARREIQARIGEIQGALRNCLDSLLDNSSRSGRWYYMRCEVAINSRRELTERLSVIADRVYPHTPHLPNELINRRHLSSAAAAARRSLLKSMLEKTSEANLGMTGNPPEHSIYQALLATSGLHRQVDGRWGFFGLAGDDSNGLRALWNAIDLALTDTEVNRVSVAELLEKLSLPPFGLKAGPFPILLCAYLLEKEAEVAVYEQGAFVPQLGLPHYERLFRHPHHFQLQRFRVAGLRANVFQELTKTFSDGQKSQKMDLLTVVRPLMQFMAALPGYTKTTQSLTAVAAKVRKALLEAEDPGKLLFQTLPEACELATFECEDLLSDSSEHFIILLRNSIQEFQIAYPKLLESIEDELFSLLEVQGRGEKARESLSSRAKPIMGLTVEDSFKGVLVRLVDDRLDRDAWLESIATALTSKPPKNWTDRDRALLATNLRQFSRRFIQVEALAHELTQQASQFTGTVYSLAVNTKDGGHLDRVLPTSLSEKEQVGLIADKVLDLLGLEGLDSKMCLAALAQAALSLQARSAEPTGAKSL